MHSWRALPKYQLTHMFTRILTALVILGSTAMAQHTTDTLDQVKAGLSEKKAVLIDVREQDEWNAGHLKAASLVPLSELKVGIAEAELAKKIPKDKVVYCHCRSGGRVIPASEILKKLGYDVRPLKSGYQDLVNSGFEKAP